MPEDKPFGWRPLSEERKQEYREMGWTEEQIESFEKTNVYSPNPATVFAQELAISVWVVMTKHLGPEIVDQVRADLDAKIKRLSESDHVEDQVDGRILAEYTQNEDWSGVRRRANEVAS